MPFENEVTFVKYSKAGKERDFHEQYENAVKAAEKYLNKEYPNIIGDEIRENEKVKLVSPINGKEIATFQAGSKDSVDKAVEILKTGQKEWFSMGYVKRAQIFLKAADLVAKDKFLISALLAHENGKTRMEAVADVVGNRFSEVLCP